MPDGKQNPGTPTGGAESTGLFELEPLSGATFGARLRFPLKSNGDLAGTVTALKADPGRLIEAFYARGGLLVLPGMNAISSSPSLLFELSTLFGPEVENYQNTLTNENAIHPSVPEILQVTNIPPTSKQPPKRPEPVLTEEGALPTQFPHRRGWHTDQSFRRPPPDVSLFYAVIPSPQGQGQTLYADGAGAYEALDNELKDTVENLEGIHAIPGIGRAEYSVRAGESPKPLLSHQMPQHQPVVRVHPVTGRQSLYLCEAGQMDWVDGPFVGLEPGPDGEGARLLYRLMSHITQPVFTYVHDWTAGDLVIYDNRSLLHSATWFDAEKHQRLMWRTTTRGNPGAEYANESRSWLPEDGLRPMEGLEDS